MTEPATSYVSEELMIVWLLLILTLLTAFFIQQQRFRWLPPSSSAMLLGIVAGVVSRLAGMAAPLRFSPGAFFYALLPPIVFQAGFAMKKRQFFANSGAILMFAVLGTFISALVFGFATYLLVLLGIVRRSHLGGSPFVECLAYGSAISSIDPVATLAVLAEVDVPPLLYNLVFGESVLNDAVAIVLFRSMSDFASQPFGIGTLPAVLLRFWVLLVGSLLIGVGVALACAFVLKRLSGSDTTGIQNAASYEIAVVIMGSYLAYLVAEVAGMSGIVALFFSGICHSHYTYYSASPGSQVSLRHLTEFGAFVCEMFVFAYLGLQVATMQHAFDFGLFFSGIPLAVASRACNVGLCSRLINSWRRHPLPPNLQRMLLAVGLRGAVAYGLVINLPRSDRPGETGIPAIETAALLIVVVTTLGLGSATGPLLRYWDLEGKDDAALYGLTWTAGLSEGMAQGQPCAPIEVEQESAFHEWFKALDEEYLKPLFGGRAEGRRRNPPSMASCIVVSGIDPMAAVLSPSPADGSPASALVYFAEPKAAANAVDLFDSHPFAGCFLEVKVADKTAAARALVALAEVQGGGGASAAPAQAPAPAAAPPPLTTATPAALAAPAAAPAPASGPAVAFGSGPAVPMPAPFSASAGSSSNPSRATSASAVPEPPAFCGDAFRAEEWSVPDNWQPSAGAPSAPATAAAPAAVVPPGVRTAAPGQTQGPEWEWNNKCRVYVTGLRLGLTADNLRGYFARFGTVVDASVVPKQQIGFVTFAKGEAGEAAMATANGCSVPGISPSGSEPLHLEFRDISKIRKHLNKARADVSEEPTTRVFIGYFPRTTTRQAVQQELSRYGETLEVALSAGTDGGELYCFVQFRNVRDAARAKTAIHGHTMPAFAGPRVLIAAFKEPRRSLY
ncbi:sodium hydrogen exchanger 3 [Micractinium conductrix]|uniref:Sodium/hydrogen exchanger n=1 Tax=Micractinium conductrix TaxID=554055 RepID=A0A2P6VLQ8_9CHLO|nr:sodium hydrogen exchanger 3 [Micractinium conductrix]|eukprot:PSC74995.1 sodium hydrogen exchanger 3 [Micractinium conductrix]